MMTASARCSSMIHLDLPFSFLPALLRLLYTKGKYRLHSTGLQCCDGSAVVMWFIINDSCWYRHDDDDDGFPIHQHQLESIQLNKKNGDSCLNCETTREEIAVARPFRSSLLQWWWCTWWTTANTPVIRLLMYIYLLFVLLPCASF